MLRSVTGIALTNTIDMTCSKYQYTDVLLCHDDQLEGRRIAFIYYLVPEWSKEDGGALDLFECDECGQPRSVVKSLLPKWNNFVFFDVNALSFHQVAEVLTPDKTRLSINGWFHGPPAARPTPFVESPPSLISPTPSGLEVLSDWINPFYLDVGVQSRVQEQFEADSQIELPGFLLEEKYSSICEEMENCQISWTVKGPPNKRCVRTSARTALPPIAKACLDFLHSGPICLLLAHLTGLELAQNIIKPVLEQDEGDPQEGGSSLGRGEGSGGEGEEVEDGQSDEGDINEGEGGDNDRNGSRTGEEEEDEGEAGREGTAPLREETQGQGDIQPVAEQAKELVHSCTEVASSRPCEDSSTSQPTDNSPEVVPVPPGTPVARCRGDLYRWQAGSYTLANDSDPLLATGEYALDLMLSFGCHGWSAELGGVTSYIAKDEDEELLSISPTPNALSLVYRDLDSLRFTSYVNHRAGSSSFYTIAMEYYEGPGPGEGRD